MIITKGYTQAGPDFLAHNLKKLLCFIENEQDRVRHNDMLREIQEMVGMNNGQRFRFSLAQTILTMAMENAANGQTNSPPRGTQTEKRAG